jgi:nucleotide-binding universal stress UspA family protein
MADSQGFAKVVVAFDGSKDSEKAVRLAGSISSKFGSEVIVVHVFSSPTIGFTAASGMPVPDYTGLEEAKRESAKGVLARGVQLAKEMGIGAKGELIEAPSVVQAIVEFAASEKADLIIAGTRGMTGFRKLIIGSVSSGLVNHSPCAVLVAR